jgi:hypothetical protein
MNQPLICLFAEPNIKKGHESRNPKKRRTPKEKKNFKRKEKLNFVPRSKLNPTEEGLCHTIALLFTLKSILRQKKKINMETQIFHHAKI